MKVTPCICVRGQYFVFVRLVDCSVVLLTRLCMWMVYSRATTSAMAERWVLPEGFLDDILDSLLAKEGFREAGPCLEN